jgi:glycosyltransferase involved in cell wall biosynthesis
VRELNRAGVPTELVVVGSTFPLSARDRPFVPFSGFIDKRSAAGRRRLESLIKTSHFLIHPARAEAYGLALCEANAYGVPCVATKVGGITTIVREGVNGFLLDPDADAAQYAELIQPFMVDPERYRQLAHASHNEYRTRLNWETSGHTVRSLIEQLSPISS